MKNTPFRKIYVFFSSVMIFMVHLPFSFATVRKEGSKPIAIESIVLANITNNVSASLKAERLVIYDSLNLKTLGLSQRAYNFAIEGLQKLKASGKIADDHLITIVDFTKSSSQKRLYIIDLENHKLLFNTYVAHGQNSGAEFAKNFSNSPSSYQSSLGFYETQGTYDGRNGYSLHLQGLEKGVNDKADERAIVMHGAPYVSEGYIHQKGYIGRSWGCPAVPEKLTRPIINEIKNGTCIFIYSENSKYLKRSKILNS